MTYNWKALNKGYNFALNLITIRGFHVELWAFKVAGVLVMGILGFPSGQNVIWMWPLWRGVENTIRAKVVASPKSRPW